MERKYYHIPTLPAGTTVATVDWNVVPAAQIDTYRWLDGGYEPHAEARLAFLPGYGFALRMSCVERSPRAIYSGYNEPVYTDSCLEFFAAWAEESPTHDRRYMNMEMNARGTLLSCLGTDRHARVPVRDITGGSIPDVRGEILPDRWSVTAGIPATLLGKVSRRGTASGAISTSAATRLPCPITECGIRSARTNRIFTDRSISEIS